MSKYVKIAVLVLAPIALAFGIWTAFFTGSGGGSLPDTWVFADVQTGEIVRKQRGTVVSIPLKNPATSAFTLFPVEQNEQGQWVVIERYRRALNDLPAGTSAKLDSATYVVDAH